jgi:hypothetical protein
MTAESLDIRFSVIKFCAGRVESNGKRLEKSFFGKKSRLVPQKVLNRMSGWFSRCCSKRRAFSLYADGKDNLALPLNNIRLIQR